MNGLDDPGPPGIVPERLAQLRQRPREGVVGHDRVAPHGGVDLRLRDEVASSIGQITEKGPSLGAERHRLFTAPQTPGASVEAVRRELDHDSRQRSRQGVDCRAKRLISSMDTTKVQ